MNTKPDTSEQTHSHSLPQSALLTEAEMSLFVDYYQLTMGNADYASRNNATITANYYVRKIPLGKYLVAAGLEQVIHYILNVSFSEDTLEWLLQRGELTEDYINTLRKFCFDGSVYAVPEGTIVFPNEPIINVTGRTRDVQLFETYLLCVMNFQTLIATKAARIVRTARGKPVYDFGARRAHGRDAGILAARSAYIGGASGTSLVLAGKYFNIPFVGTMAHKFVMDRTSEIEAFRDYTKAFPHNSTLLIDTYDTVQGARNACIVAKEMEESGFRLNAVRLDSGDLATLSLLVRSILDDAGLDYVQIIASHELDEYEINKLLEKEAPIDSYGVGTRLATGANLNSHTGIGGTSALGGVYKPVERDGTPVGKLSFDEPEKATVPGRKQIYRITDTDGYYRKDCVTLWDESMSDGKPILIPIVIDGELVYNFPNLTDIQERTKTQLTNLPDKHQVLSNAKPYPVEIHPRLKIE